MPTFVLSREAEIDIAGISEYIAKHNVTAAIKMLDLIQRSLSDTSRESRARRSSKRLWCARLALIYREPLCRVFPTEWKWHRRSQDTRCKPGPLSYFIPIMTAITGWRKLNLISKNARHRNSGASLGSSKPLARQFSNRWYRIGFANVLVHHFFTFVFSNNVAQQALERFFTLTCPQSWATLTTFERRLVRSAWKD